MWTNHTVFIGLIQFFSDLTFGRDIGRYWQLVEFLAIVSLVLWALVILTTLLRWLSFGYAWLRRSRPGGDNEKGPLAATE